MNRRNSSYGDSPAHPHPCNQRPLLPLTTPPAGSRARPPDCSNLAGIRPPNSPLSRNEDKIATLAIRTRLRHSQRGQDQDACNKDKIATLATRTRLRRLQRGRICNAHNKDKIATIVTMTDHEDDRLQRIAKKMTKDPPPRAPSVITMTTTKDPPPRAPRVIATTTTKDPPTRAPSVITMTTTKDPPPRTPSVIAAKTTKDPPPRAPRVIATTTTKDQRAHEQTRQQSNAHDAATTAKLTSIASHESTANSKLLLAVCYTSAEWSEKRCGYIGTSSKFCIKNRLQNFDHCGTPAHTAPKYTPKPNTYYAPTGTSFGCQTAESILHVPAQHIPRRLKQRFATDLFKRDRWMTIFNETIRLDPIETTETPGVFPPTQGTARGSLTTPDAGRCPPNAQPSQPTTNTSTTPSTDERPRMSTMPVKRQQPQRRHQRRRRLDAVLTIQAFVRRWLAKRNLNIAIRSTTKIQKSFRGWLPWDIIDDNHYFATKIQKSFRGWLAREVIDDNHYFATQIQRVAQGYLATTHVFDNDGSTVDDDDATPNDADDCSWDETSNNDDNYDAIAVHNFEASLAKIHNNDEYYDACDIDEDDSVDNVLPGTSSPALATDPTQPPTDKDLLISCLREVLIEVLPSTLESVLTGALANRVDAAISKPSTTATPNNSNDAHNNNYEEYDVELDNDDENPLNEDNINNDDDEPNNESDDDYPNNGSDNNTSHNDGGSDANNNPDGHYNGYDDGSNGYDNGHEDGSYDNYDNDSYEEKYNDRYRNECTQQKYQAIDVCTHGNGEQQSSPPPAATNVVTPPYQTAVPRAISNAAITPIVIAIFDPTSSGGVLHLHNVLGLPFPPPKTSRSNSPRLHTSTLVYH
jgi:hypothetical protein